MKGKIVYFLTIVICFLLQCTVMDLISIGSVTPNLMLVFCVSMGLMRGRKSGLTKARYCRNAVKKPCAVHHPSGTAGRERQNPCRQCSLIQIPSVPGMLLTKL